MYLYSSPGLNTDFNCFSAVKLDQCAQLTAGEPDLMGLISE